MYWTCQTRDQPPNGFSHTDSTPLAYNRGRDFVSLESQYHLSATCFSPFGFPGNEHKRTNLRLPLTGSSATLCNSLSLCCDHARQFHNRSSSKNTRELLHFLLEHKSRNGKENVTRSLVLIWFRSDLLGFSQHCGNFLSSLFPLISKRTEEAPGKRYS